MDNLISKTETAAEKPLITVVGILGKQGFSVANSLLQSGRYRVRGITRRADAPQALELIAQGVELVSVPLDLGYRKEYEKAFQSSYGAFLLTPNITPPDTHEAPLGKELADAALAAGVQHIVFSSLENVDKLTNGKKVVPHFTDKGLVEAYIGTLPVKSSFIKLAFFYTNSVEFFTPFLKGDTLMFPYYLPENFQAPFVDPRTATGPAVLELFSHPDMYNGKSLPVIGEFISPREMVETFTKVTGKKADYVSTYGRKEFVDIFPSYGSNAALVDEIIQMAEYAVKYGYFSKDADIEWSRRINPETLTWEGFLRSTNWQGQKMSF